MLHRPDNVDGSKLLSDFCDFCKVDLGLAESTAKEYRRKRRRFFEVIKKPAESVIVKDVRAYLKPIKRFFRDFVRMGHVVESFRFRKIQLRSVVVLSKEQLREFYRALKTLRACA